jgi:hypothetical protein
MKLDVLNRTPGLLFTLLLIAFVIGTMVDSLWVIRKKHDQPPPATPAPPAPPASKDDDDE